MTWSTIRKATKEDAQRLRERATAFCQRHDICDFMEDPVDAVEHLVNSGWDYRHDVPLLRKLWRAVVGRALGKGATGIAYGYVGYSVR